MLIDKSYFYGNRQIPQLQEQTVIDTVNAFIESYEPVYMERLLGVALYNDLNTALESDPTLVAVENELYKNLRDGVTYVDKYTHTQKWKGLLFTTGATKNSPIADYTYFYLLRHLVSSTTGTGEKKTDSKNSTNHSVFFKQKEAWNRMAHLNRELLLYMQSSPTVYTSWIDPFTYQYKRQHSNWKDVYEMFNIITVL